MLQSISSSSSSIKRSSSQAKALAAALAAATKPSVGGVSITGSPTPTQAREVASTMPKPAQITAPTIDSSQVAASMAANPQASTGGYVGSDNSMSTTPGSQQSIIPDPVVYEGETAAALKAYNDALTAISARRAGTLQNYGMTAHVDANGNLQDYAIDPNNQYGQIQQLLKGQGSDITGLEHAAIDRGLGSTGLGAQAVNAYRQAAGGQQLNLGQQFVGEIGNEASDQISAGDNYSAAKLQAQRDAITSAIQNGWFTPAPMSGSSTTTLGNQFTPPTTTPPPSPGLGANNLAAALAKIQSRNLNNKNTIRPTYGNVGRQMGVGL